MSSRVFECTMGEKNPLNDNGRSPCLYLWARRVWLNITISETLSRENDLKIGVVWALYLELARCLTALFSRVENSFQSSVLPDPQTTEPKFKCDSKRHLYIFMRVFVGKKCLLLERAKLADESLADIVLQWVDHDKFSSK